MTQACLANPNQRYSNANSSPGVSQYAEALNLKPRQKALEDNSITIGHRYSQLFQQIVNARGSAEVDDWDGEGAPAITQSAVDGAVILSISIPQSLPVPTVRAEPTGEISFEWYKDRRHVAVVTVDGDFVRWSAIAGTDAMRSGAEPYLKALPGAALNVIREVLG
jgi:hypothetical protein